MRKMGMRSLVWAVGCGALPMALTAQATRKPATVEVAGDVYATNRRGEVVRGAGLLVRFWPTDSSTVALLDAACTAAKKDDMSWMLARMALTNDSVRIDSADAGNVRLLRQLMAVSADTVRADVNGHYSIRLSAPARLLAFSQIEMAGRTYQWWKPISVALASTMRVDLSPADIKETQFCR